MKIYLIYVHYGNSSKDYICDIDKNYGELEVIKVNTGSESISGVNDRNEFSGYKYGLDQIKLEFNQSNIRIVFINDTFFYGHFKPFARELLHHLVCSKFKEGSFSGVLSSFDHIIYNSTWIFSLDLIKASHVNDIQFFPHGLKKSNFAKLFLKLDKSYQVQIQSWLYPKNILKGWHKSSHKIKISEKRFYEKAFMIYLEQTLPRRLLKYDYHLRDAIRDNRKLRLLHFFDRIKYVGSKLIFRIFHSGLDG